MQGARVFIHRKVKHHIYTKFMANCRDDHTVSGMVLMNLTSIKLILKKTFFTFFLLNSTTLGIKPPLKDVFSNPTGSGVYQILTRLDNLGNFSSYFTLW